MPIFQLLCYYFIYSAAAGVLLFTVKIAKLY